MKTLALLFAITLVGCAGGGGGQTNGAEPAVPVDSTPHDYTTGFFNANGLLNAVTIHRTCDEATTGFRDETVSLSEGTSGFGGGVGCTAAKNIRAIFTNTGAVSTLLVFTIDGVYHPELDRVLAPAEIYIFERGY